MKITHLMKIEIKIIIKKKIQKGEMNMEIAYHQEGDYMIPNLTLSMQEQKKVNLGKYGRMKLKYLKENKRGLWQELIMTGKLTTYLAEVDKLAMKRVNQIIQELAKKNQVNEEMKIKEQMKWVGLMNNFKNQAEEIVF